MNGYRFGGEPPSLSWVKWTDHIRVQFPGWLSTQNDYELIRNLFGLRTEPAGFILKGRTGTGKTAAAKAYKARFPDHREGKEWNVKVCHAVVPPTPTRRGVVRCLLKGFATKLT